MYNYSPLRATAVKLITSFGKNLTLRTMTNSGSAFDPTVTNTDTPIVGVMLGYRAAEVDGTLIQAGDMQVLTYDPVTVEQKIIDGGKAFSVVSVTTVSPSVTPLIYKVQVRK